MKLESKVSTLQKTGPSLEDRVQFLCARAKELEDAGEFEAAQGVLGEFWQRIGVRPEVDALSPVAQAGVFLRAGTLSGWIGSFRQITGAQESAKDLISEAARIFEENDSQEHLAEARVELAICYWREGALDEARVTLDEALRQLGDVESEQRLRALLNRATIEKLSHRYDDSLRRLREAAPLFQSSTNNALKGKFHNEHASVLKNLGLAQDRSDYIDQALVEYTAATVYLEQAGNQRFLAMVENNIGLLLARLGRLSDAQVYLDRARSLFVALKDKGMVAQVDDTRARAFITEGLFTKAETLARASVRVLEEGDELSLLAGALTTHGTTLARLGNFSNARATFEKAIRTAHNAGDPESGGVAALSMAEELTSYLPFSELVAYYRIAESELAKSQREEIQNRLNMCARLLLSTKSALEADSTSMIASRSNGNESNLAQTEFDAQVSNASLEEQVRQYEGKLISHALQSSDGSVTRAARILGITHQGLAFILNGRHKDLLPARKPVKKRRRSIIRFH
ncbi:MAG: helix-turn-helix domain-containing protein [Acidobacteriota bacterium]